MDSSLVSVLSISLYAIYFMLPAYLANISALAFGGGKPIDAKRNFWDGRRLLGDGKTWRGIVIGIIMGTIIGVIQGIVSIFVIQAYNIYAPLDSYYYIILPLNVMQGFIFGFIMSTGALIGDLAGSFIKRRFKLARGRPAPVLDQLDFVIGALIFISLIIVVPVNLIIYVLILTLFLHLGANIIAYLLGLKEVWY